MYINREINKTWYTYMMKYFSEAKRNDLKNILIRI
jgi:hypothetical protein